MDAEKIKTKWIQALDLAVSGHQVEAMLPPHVKFLHLPPISSWKDNYIIIDWQATEEAYQGSGMVFGGYISALADYAAGTAMLTVIEDEDLFVTQQLVVDYIKPIKAGAVLIKAEVVDTLSRNMKVIVTFTNSDGELCSEAIAHQKIINRSD
ncbi:MAG: PaaI family thioesterase [Cellvibrionales bacterium]|nr:PaaI family thioesterase [Cellvibrionales bacterium]